MADVEEVHSYFPPRHDPIELVRDKVGKLAFALMRGDEITDDIRRLAKEVANCVGWAVLDPDRYERLLRAWIKRDGTNAARMGVWYYRRSPLGLPVTPEDFERAKAEGRPESREPAEQPEPHLP
jgi:hypothetical protein